VRSRVTSLLAQATGLAFLCAAPAAPGQNAEPEPTLLWPGGAPGAAGGEDVDKPALFLHAADPALATGTCVVICPGGGYGGLMMGYEGNDVARWFKGFGVSAAVLRYRLAPRYRDPAMLQDVRRAVRHLRANAPALGLAADRIGVMGFSAGGHLAASAGVHAEPGDPAVADPVERQSSRPDFLILAYPVISMRDGTTHRGSRDNLLGPNPAPEAIERMSLETRVTAETPPAFLIHTGEDKTVPVENSILFYSALRKAGVPAELHVFRSGPHGIGLDRFEATRSWPALLQSWMKHLGLLKKQG